MLADLAGSVPHCKGAQHIALEGTQHQQQGIRLQPRTAWRCVRFGTQFSKPSRKFWGCSATSLPEDQPDKASTQRHKAQAKQALKSLEDAGKIGSEYGEVGSCGDFGQIAVIVASASQHAMLCMLVI